MGYYIGTENVDIFLDKKYFDDVYKKMCELNDYDELKSGGQFGKNQDPVDGERYNRNKWFAWMPYNYPETLSTMDEVLEAIGFDTEYDTEGNLVGLGYWNKTGAQDYFMSCFAGFIKDESFIQWKGEESEDYFRYFFKDGKMIVQRAEMILDYSNGDDDVYEFGKMSSADAAFDVWRKNLDEEKRLEKENTEKENTDG